MLIWDCQSTESYLIKQANFMLATTDGVRTERTLATLEESWNCGEFSTGTTIVFLLELIDTHFC